MNEILTKQDKTFVKEIVKTANGTKSAKKAYKYKNDNTAGVMANRKLRSVKIQNAIQSIAEQLPDKLLAERHIELLNKREVHQIGYGEDKEYEFSDEPDTQAVSKALDMAYKLKGSYAPDKNININMNVKSIDPTNPEVLEALKTINSKRANEQ